MLKSCVSRKCKSDIAVQQLCVLRALGTRHLCPPSWPPLGAGEPALLMEAWGLKICLLGISFPTMHQGPLSGSIFCHTYNQATLSSPSFKRITLTEQINFGKKWPHTYLYISSGKGCLGLQVYMASGQDIRCRVRVQSNVLSKWGAGSMGWAPCCVKYCTSKYY